MVLPESLIIRVKEQLATGVAVGDIINEARVLGHQISSSTIYKIRQSHIPAIQKQKSFTEIKQPSHQQQTQQQVQEKPIFIFQQQNQPPLSFETFSQQFGVGAIISSKSITVSLLQGTLIVQSREYLFLNSTLETEFDKFVGFIQLNNPKVVVIASPYFNEQEQLILQDEIIDVRKAILNVQLFLKHDAEVVSLKYQSLFKKKVIYLHFSNDYLKICVRDDLSSQIIPIEHFLVQKHPDDHRNFDFCKHHQNCALNLTVAQSVVKSQDYDFISSYIAQVLYSLYLMNPTSLFVLGGQLFDNQQVLCEAITPVISETPLTTNTNFKQTPILLDKIRLEFTKIYANFGPTLNLAGVIYLAEKDSIIKGVLHLVMKELKESNGSTPCDFIQAIVNMSPQMGFGLQQLVSPDFKQHGLIRLENSSNLNRTPALDGLLDEDRVDFQEKFG